jgi:hypothetical protein
MKATDLHKIWSAPDNSRLTLNELPLRLPVHVAARIQALADMYPAKNRGEIVADLLAAALADVEKGFPPVMGSCVGQDDKTREQLFEDVGPVVQYQRLANDYYLAMEKELGNPKAQPLFAGPVIRREHEFEH